MIPIDNEQVRLLEERLRGVGVDRRTFLKIAAAATSGPLAVSLLAACGGGNNTPATATSGTGATTPTAGSAVTPTTAVSPTTAATKAASPMTPASPTRAASPTTAATKAASPTSAVTGNLDAQQILYDYGLRNGDPASHDFNGNLYSNGVGQLWAGLTTYDQDFNLLPDWAETWESNADASVWTFNLRKNNTGFSNGDPVTAPVFVYSWRRLLANETQNPYASILFDIKNGQEFNGGTATAEDVGVRAIDDWTLEVTMVGPRGLFPVITSFIAAVPTHPPSVDKFGATYTDPNETGQPLISNGPFKLTKWDHNVTVDVEKNPNYWNADNIKLQTVINKIIPIEQGFLPYEAGDVDWSLVPPADLLRVQSDPVLSQEVQKWVEPLIWKMLPAVNTEPFQDVRVRKALQKAIDRDRINELTNQGGDPAYSLVPPGIFAYFGDEFKPYVAYDKAAAMAALAGTPYEGGQNWPSVTMILRDESNLGSQLMAEDVVSQIQDAIGLNIKLQVMDFQSFNAELFKNQYQIAWIRWYYDYPDPNNGYYDMFYSQKDSGKRQAWSNQQFDALVIKGKEEKDPTAREEIYRQAETIMQDEVAYVPVVYRNAYDAYKPWVKGVPVNKQGFVIPNGNIYVGMWNTIYIQGRNA